MKKFLLLFFLASFSAEAQIVNIPDANFKAKLLEASPTNTIANSQGSGFIKIDVNQDGEIQESEAALVYNLNIDNSGIVSLEGIQSFSNLSYLRCNNNSISNLEPVMFLSKLQYLEVVSNNINYIDFTNNTFLYTHNSGPGNTYFGFDCSDNPLTDINFTGIVKMYFFTCSNTLLEGINFGNVIFSGFNLIEINNNPNLTEITINIDNAHSLFVKHNDSLTSLTINLLDIISEVDVYANQNLHTIILNTDVDFGSPLISNPILDFFYIDNNPAIANIQFNTGINDNIYIYDISILGNLIESLDFSNVNFDSMDLSMSELNILNLKNGYTSNIPGYLNSFGTPNLQYVCANEWDIEYLNNHFLENEINDVNINSYCSFTPGGEFFTIQGNSKLNLLSEGCDENDTDFPNMKFNITDGTVSGNIISNASGNYSIPVQAGTHTVTPVFENPTYFNVSPPNFAVAFPAQASPFTQNFCLTPNGVHQDVEVVIVPLNVAIPGFDTSYKLVYKNKGNTVVSGSLSLTFTDNVMDFVSSTPVQSMVEPNILNWNYTNLQPFETREIQVVFNLNSPQETPALNSGDILEFIAIVDPLSGDAMPSDNTSTLNQEVVNSYDPNDKTCLEGSVVSTELIGQYVHYVIRFENTGTFFAQNVVVKDEIDLSKFDISTLIPQHSSHDYFTRINGNKVEFIFENIQLPFPPSEERHGYIAFKIKLKNNLTVGDTFSNFASIYFDYNFPIITEPAITTIEALSNPDFEFSSFVKLHPNPTNSILTIESQSAINLKSVEIFNSLGQLIQAIPNDNNQLNIDVSHLQTGTYFVKVYSDKGVGVSKFVKQ